MLPKVATHILHQTSRAVTAAHTQTGQTLRNVIQLQTQSGTPATASTSLGGWNGASSWGSGGAGPGGAKFNAGSRFYNGYTGAGRAVTQANTANTNDTANGHSEDTDELTAKRVPLHRSPPKSRNRSHSLSVEGRQERGETLGVLKTVQLHTRSNHVFANSTSIDAVPESSARPVLVRRNSTSAPLESFDSLPPLPESPTPIAARTVASTDPAAPQSTTEPTEPDFYPNESSTDIYLDLKHARNKKDAAQVVALVQNLKSRPQTPTTPEFNMALEALHDTRRAGEPLNILLDTYNWMIKQSVVPNVRTYMILILALTDRDNEVHKTIMALESRSKRRLRSETTVSALPDQQRIEQLRSENNFASAMSLFEAASAIAWNTTVIPIVIYSNLLRSCAYHSNIDAAIHVFAHLERRSDFKPSAVIFSNLISVYTNVGDLQGAKEVFAEYRTAIAEDRVSFNKSTDGVSESARAANLFVWNRMIEAYFRCGEYVGALTLLEQMMDSKATSEGELSDIPPPASSTFTQIIAGFCQAGDVPSAFSWFNRLLEQNSTANSPHQPLTVPPKPDQVAWTVMLEALATENMIPELNRLFGILEKIADADGLHIRAVDRILLFEANLRYMDEHVDMLDAEAKSTLDFLAQIVLAPDQSTSSLKIHRWGRRKILEQLVERYIKAGEPIAAFDLMEPAIRTQLATLHSKETLLKMKPQDVQEEIEQLRNTVRTFTAQALHPDTVRDQPLPFPQILRFLRLSEAVGLLPSAAIAPYYLNAYAAHKASGKVVQMEERDWELMLYASTSMELPHNVSVEQMHNNLDGTAALLEDLKNSGVELSQLQKPVIRRVIKAVFMKHGAEELHALFARLGPSYKDILISQGQHTENVLQHGVPTISPDAIQPPASPPQKAITVDAYHSRFVEEFYPNHPTISPILAYSRFEGGVAKGLYPIPATIGRLINALGRLHEMDKVRRLYDAAQLVMATLEDKSHWQSNAWFQIEDNMVIACAHAGEMEAAFAHRARITAQGGTPSPDAYGALIECVKDTTDDTSNAMDLYRESQAVGCVPNVYLFNTIISKLAKARKADHALELFQEMKAIGTRPSSITYGAVIAACARVGDTMSAEQLFVEMSEQPNFKPRIPPFNTMMQMYTHTKPNRERVIYYYNALLSARITPSAHTYKLLLDAYGTIEPVDAPAMGKVFRELEGNKRVAIQGAHWASLINAWGCVQKDLNKAIEVFDSIASHASTLRSSTPLPDAVTYEAMINVLATHRRMDLVPAYMERLQASGIHMTAYIANLLIKGHAAVGDVAQARKIFESLEDPPTGVAATSNHVPHSSSKSSSPPSPAPGPCHREPSTWEAMFRAELGSGNRENALALLERLQARQYPPAVYNRISGIMLDDSVSPWAAS